MEKRWITVWSQSHTRAGFGVKGRKNRTVQFSFDCPLDGDGIRLRFSNHFSEEKYEISAVSAHIAGSCFSVKRGGNTKFYVAPGERVTSDILETTVHSGDVIEVRIFVSSDQYEGNSTVRNARWSKKGDYTGGCAFEADPSEFRKRSPGILRFVPVIESIEILTDKQPKVIAGFGDSITQQSLWIGPLSKRLYDAYGDQIILLNAGIGGNRIVNEDNGFYRIFGPSGINRCQRDLLEIPELGCVIFALGTNDIGMGKKGKPDFVDAAQMIDGALKIIAQLHDKNIRVIGTTILPRKGSSGYRESYNEETRTAFNEWVRSSGSFDAVIDFDQIMKDDIEPLKIKKGYAMFDQVHPNEKGGLYLANAIDLELLYKLAGE